MCFKVKLTKKTIKITGIETPNETFYFFDTENYLPVVTEAEIKQGAMKGQKIISKMIDYQELEGVCFPFALNQFGGDMKVKKNILNPSLEDKEFVFSVK
ncbi:hypothetical protein JJC03_10795 [Flavobacterium oreochromis]|uniref:hypothetical protein n=1 Tax=Flavobacterium oreochromis TaxID=2906078 RepID=UPI001CE5B6CB|nr:hypothetical protein [Flavobacterium oreochromis]QYS85667.1 hypothetical protein JJC03_10795 [Flavobacterium oreochromis]